MGSARGRDGRPCRVDGMARGAGEPSAKRAKVDGVRRKEEVVRLLEEASAKGKELVRKAEEEAERLKREAEDTLAPQLCRACADIEATNLDELLKKLPPELWEKILDENLDQNDLLALVMTCRFFRKKQKDLGKNVETNLKVNRLHELQESGKMVSHSLGWFQWVCDTLNILPGHEWNHDERVNGTVYEGDLLNYAVLQGSVEILRWMMEKKGWESNGDTGAWAGFSGSVQVLEYLVDKGYEFNTETCQAAAGRGHLEAVRFLRGLDPPAPWDWLTCFLAAQQGRLEVFKFLRAQHPPCPWSRSDCRDVALNQGHEHIVKWIDEQEDESDAEYTDLY